MKYTFKIEKKMCYCPDCPDNPNMFSIVAHRATAYKTGTVAIFLVCSSENLYFFNSNLYSQYFVINTFVKTSSHLKSETLGARYLPAQ